MQIPRAKRGPSPDSSGPPTYATEDTHWWDGSNVYGGDKRFADALRKARTGAEDRRPGTAAGGAREAGRPQGRRGQLLDRPRTSPLAVHARAQRDLRPPAREVPRPRRRDALPEGPSRERGADGEDPHRRLDAGGDRAPDDGGRPPRELVGHPRRGLRQALRAADEQRGDPRDPGLTDRPSHGAVLADRGVRRRLQDAPADPGRLHVPFSRRRRRPPGAHARGDRRARRPRAPRRDADERRLLFVRTHAPSAIELHNFRASSSTSSGPQATRSTWPRSTSSGRASAASRATTSSAACST